MAAQAGDEVGAIVHADLGEHRAQMVLHRAHAERQEGGDLRIGEPETETFIARVPEDAIAVTHGGGLFLGMGPPGIAPLEEPRIRDALALLLKIRNTEGEVIGFASELETFPANADLMEPDTVWDTDWTLMIPGRGSLCLRQQEIAGPLGADVVGPARAAGGVWEGHWRVKTTHGPLPGGRGRIAGGAGEFEGARQLRRGRDARALRAGGADRHRGAAPRLGRLSAP